MWLMARPSPHHGHLSLIEVSLFVTWLTDSDVELECLGGTSLWPLNETVFMQLNQRKVRIHTTIQSCVATNSCANGHLQRRGSHLWTGSILERLILCTSGQNVIQLYYKMLSSASSGQMFVSSLIKVSLALLIVPRVIIAIIIVISLLLFLSNFYFFAQCKCRDIALYIIHRKLQINN